MEGRKGRQQAWWALALVGLLVLASCSSGRDEPSRKRHEGGSGGSETASETTGSSSSTPAAPLPVLTTTRFQTPSGKIHCEAAPYGVACLTDYRLVNEPSHDLCHEYWVGLFIRPGEYAGPMCSGSDAGISREPAHELLYDHTWALDGVTCLSEHDGLTCRDEMGNGFTVAMARWSLLGKEAAATAAFPALRNMVRTQAASDDVGHIASVPTPILQEGDGCGELQGAYVPVDIAMGESVTYTACFVTGEWVVTGGPLVAE